MTPIPVVASSPVRQRYVPTVFCVGSWENNVTVSILFIVAAPPLGGTMYMHSVDQSPDGPFFNCSQSSTIAKNMSD